MSERGHNLKVEGKSKWIEGKFGNALWFDKDAFVAYNPGKAIEDFSFENAFSFEFWINIESIVPKRFLGFQGRKGSTFLLSAKRPKDGGWIPISTTAVGSKLHRRISATMGNGTITLQHSKGKKSRFILTGS